MRNMKPLRFKAIEIFDKKDIEVVTNNFLPYSDFNFVSLFSWGVNRSSGFALLDNHLIIKLRSYTEEGYIYSIVGSGDVSAAIDQLFNIQGLTRFELVPEEVAKTTNKYGLTHQRDEDDYVYDIHALLNMEGPGYKHFRRSLSNFASKNQSIKVNIRIINHRDEASKQAALELSRHWRKSKKRTFGEAANEYFAIRKALKFSEALGLRILGFYDHSNLIGFTVVELLGEWNILHFEKSNPGYPGLGAYVKYETFKYLAEQEGSYKLNYEQDLGIEGLREAKLALCPERFLTKYIIEKL